jgi:hypothetical protein
MAALPDTILGSAKLHDNFREKISPLATKLGLPAVHPKNSFLFIEIFGS